MANLGTEFQIGDYLTIVILCSPLDSNPSTEIVTRTIESLNFICERTKLNVLISHDFPKRKLGDIQRKRYDKYLVNLENQFSDEENVQIIKLEKHGFLSGNVKNALQRVSTPFVLVMQHDLPFVSEIKIEKLIKLMLIETSIKHCRFNKKINTPTGWDGATEERIEFYEEASFGDDNGIKMCRTLAWSDNNHLVQKEYYDKLVFNLLKNRKTYPENVINPLNTQETWKLFGTWIYGPYGSPPTIEHVDSRVHPRKTLRWKLSPNRLLERFSKSLTNRLSKKRVGGMLGDSG